MELQSVLSVEMLHVLGEIEGDLIESTFAIQETITAVCQVSVSRLFL